MKLSIKLWNSRFPRVIQCSPNRRRAPRNPAAIRHERRQPFPKATFKMQPFAPKSAPIVMVLTWQQGRALAVVGRDASFARTLTSARRTGPCDKRDRSWANFFARGDRRTHHDEARPEASCASLRRCHLLADLGGWADGLQLRVGFGAQDLVQIERSIEDLSTTVTAP